MISLKQVNVNDYNFLYKLLEERPKECYISHQGMPSYIEHVRFCEQAPYRKWYIIMYEGKPAGSIYMTYRNEIGIFILKKFHRKGIGKKVIPMVYEKKNLANINPENKPSIKLFEGLGFKHIQNTYRRDNESQD